MLRELGLHVGFLWWFWSAPCCSHKAQAVHMQVYAKVLRAKRSRQRLAFSTAGFPAPRVLQASALSPGEPERTPTSFNQYIQMQRKRAFMCRSAGHVAASMTRQRPPGSTGFGFTMSDKDILRFTVQRASQNCSQLRRLTSMQLIHQSRLGSGRLQHGETPACKCLTAT